MAAPAKSILDMGSNKIIALLDGTANTDAINLGQLNSSQDAQPFKKKVRAATTANITLSGTQTVDGVGLLANERCLVKDQSTASQNGIYVVSAGAWSRATDADVTADFADGQTVQVAEGTLHADSLWVLTTDSAITVGTTSLAYKRLSRANQATAGTYGSASQVPVAVLNDDGTVSSFTNTAISIGASGVTGLTAGQVLYGGSGGAIAQDANIFWDSSLLNFKIGQPASGTARIIAKGSTTNDTGYILQGFNSTPTETIRVSNDGYYQGNGLGKIGKVTTSDFAIVATLDQSITLSDTSGSRDFYGIKSGVAPTSGTATFNFINLGGSINQTGGANGITSGVKVGTTLTAAADYRAVWIATTSQKGLWQDSATPTNLLAGKTGLGTQTSPSYILDIGDTGGIRIPVGTTAQRPTTNTGVIRYNTDLTQYEGWNGSAWSALGAGSVSISALVAATGNNTIDNTNFAQTWNWSTLTTGTALTMTSSGMTTGSLVSLSASNASLNSSNGVLYVGNGSSSTSGTVFKVQSNNNVAGAGLIVRANAYVGIGTTSPVAPLSVAGIPFVSNIGVSGMLVSLDGSLGITDNVTAVSGTVANTAVVGVPITTIYAANTSVTYTNASSVYIAGAPAAGTNLTITNPYSLYVNAGNAYFGGSIGVGIKPVYPIDVNSTGAIRIPVGTAAQQPTAAAGLIRLNSTNPSFDYHDGTAWRTVITTAVAAVGQGSGNNQLTYFSTVGNITSNANGSFNGTYMGLGVTFTTGQRLTIVGSGATSATYALRVHNSGGTNNQLVVRNDGRVGILVDPLYTFHVNGVASIGDSVTASNSTRALNLASTTAVMRILRISADSITAAPAFELMHRTTSDGSNDVYYDVFADTTGLSFRDRFNLADIKVLQIGVNGKATNRCVDAATAALVTTQTYSLNSSGTAAANFGARTLWQLESSTTNDQDAASIDTYWTVATHGTRTAGMSFKIVTSAAALAEIFLLNNGLAKTTGNSQATGQSWAGQFALTDGATINTNWNNGNTQTVTLAGNRTMATPTNPQTGATYTYIIKQDATGGRTLTWYTIRWAGGVAPTLTATANKWDIITLKYDGTNYFGTASLNF